MWGFITVLVDSLIPSLREIFELSYFEAGLVQFAFFIAYGLVSIPSGWLLSRIGYKNGMLVGLATMGVGCLLFWPAAGLRLFPLFMLGYFILGSGHDRAAGGGQPVHSGAWVMNAARAVA